MLLQAQAEMIWKIKDVLNSDLNNALLKEMLLANKQKAPSTAAKVSLYLFTHHTFLWCLCYCLNISHMLINTVPFIEYIISCVYFVDGGIVH